MKKILFITAFAVLMLAGSAFSQITLDQHNNRVWLDSLDYLVGQTTDTSTAVSIAYYSEIGLFTYTDESSSQDSASITVWIDIAPTSTGPWYKIDSLVCDSVVANLPSTNYNNITLAESAAAFLRLRTQNKNGANDSAFVANRLFLSE